MRTESPVRSRQMNPMNNNGSLGPGSTSGDGEEWWDSGYILKVAQTESQVRSGTQEKV